MTPNGLLQRVAVQTPLPDAWPLTCVTGRLVTDGGAPAPPIISAQGR
jgi:hypothetical protein